MHTSEGTSQGTALALLPGDNPQAYVPGDRRVALARGESLPTTCRGSAVFVDISGFTPLTEALARELGGRRGAEELTATLDRVFAALLGRLHAWGGSVVYFSGDAVTAWVDGDDGSRAVACGVQMQHLMDQVGRVTTPGGTKVRLAVKVSVAVGTARRFVVGDPGIQLIDVLAGRVMDAMADAEHQASPGEVVLDAVAVAALGDRVRLRDVRAGALGEVGVVEGLVDPLPDPGPEPALPMLPLDVVRRWLLPPVWERMAEGRGELLAELRPAVPMFVQIDGLDLEGDPDAAAVLDAVVTTAQRTLAEVGGHVLQLTIGDKGVNLYAVVGSPIAHEDDPDRACTGALALRRATADLPVTDLRIGIATGQLRSGTYGHPERRTFCCLGDAVNLAARLMVAAPSGGILVQDAVAAATRGAFEWTARDPMTVKGKVAPVAVRELHGEASALVPRQRQGSQDVERLVGRDDELSTLRRLWERAARGEGQVVLLRAEAGVGKSRLASALADELTARGVTVGWAEATRTSGGASYAAWRPMWWTLLGLDPETADADALHAAVAELEPQLVPRAPLLGPLLGIACPDNELTASFDGELRKTSLEDLAGRLLRARAERGALMLVLDDGHWLDGLARDLLTAATRAVRGTPVLLVVTARPGGTTGSDLPPLPGSHVAELPLGTLSADAAAQMVTDLHRARTGSPPSPSTLATVLGRAEGNPFYLVQLVDYLLAHTDEGDADSLELPPSLHSLVLSRIDAQPEGSRRAVKVASVVGRDFRSPVVAHSYELGEDDEVHGHLLSVASTHLIELEDEQDQTFSFGHTVTHEVAYDSLPLAVRTVLHGRVGETLEHELVGDQPPLDLLAFHYSRSDLLPKRRHYLLAAAEAARAAYANEAAVAYLEQVLPQIGPDERPEVLLRLAELQDLAGDWAGAESTLDATLEAALEAGAPQRHAQALTARADLARRQGRYAEAQDLLETAEREYAAAGDQAGTGRVMHLRGTLASQQGDTARARASYEASLAVRQELGDEAGVAAMLTNLALVAEDEGDLDEAERIGLDALARRRALGAPREVSVSLMNMGMLAEAREEHELARDRFTEALALAEEVGDPWLAAVGRHNLGNTSRDLGDLDAAAQHLAHALAAYTARDDRWSIAHVLEDVALWLLADSDRRDREAVRLLAGAQAVRTAIGAPRFAPTEAAIERALTPARERTPGPELAEAEAAGVADPDAAVALAASLLDA